MNISGLDKWERYIENVSREAVEEVKNALKVTALSLERDAKQLCPVDSGHLRRSITTKFKDEGLTADVGTNVEYAPYVEFGTSKQPAQPFMTPSYAKHKKELAEKVEDIIGGIGK